MPTLTKPLSVEFEHYPPVDFDPDEIDRHRGKPAIDALRDLLATKYPDVGRQIAGGGGYDLEMSLHGGGGPAEETALRTSSQWDEVADQCQRQRVAVGMAEHVRGGV